MTIRAFLRSQDGATAVEYGLIACLISVAIIAALQMIGVNLTGAYRSIAAGIALAGR